MNRDHEDWNQQDTENQLQNNNSVSENEIENFQPDQEFDDKFSQDDDHFYNDTEESDDPYSWADDFEVNKSTDNDVWHDANEKEPTIISGTKTLPPLTPARRVAEGALMAALSVILGFLAFYTPVLSIVLLVLYPFPITYLIKRHNIATGLTAFAVSAVLLGLVLGIHNAAFVILSMGAVGIWYGIAFRKNLKPMKTLLVGAVLAALSVVCTTVLSFATMGTSVADITATITESVNQTVTAMQNSGIYDFTGSGISVEDFKNSMINMMTTMIPGMFIVVAMLESWLCYVLTTNILRRMGLDIRPLPRFRYWHLPWPALWGLIIALISYIGYHFLEYEILKTVAINILYIYYPILLIVGISLVIWLRKVTGAIMLPILIIISVILFPAGALLGIIILGLADTIIDFRTKAEKNRQKYNKRK